MMKWHLVALAGAALLAASAPNPAAASPLGSAYASHTNMGQSDIVLVHSKKRRHYRRHNRRLGFYYGPRYYYPYYGRYYYGRPYYPRRYYRRHRPGFSLYFRF